MLDIESGNNKNVGMQEVLDYIFEHSDNITPAVRQILGFAALYVHDQNYDFSSNDLVLFAASRLPSIHTNSFLRIYKKTGILASEVIARNTALAAAISEKLLPDSELHSHPSITGELEQTHYVSFIAETGLAPYMWQENVTQYFKDKAKWLDGLQNEKPSAFLAYEEAAMIDVVPNGDAGLIGILADAEWYNKRANHGDLHFKF